MNTMKPTDEDLFDYHIGAADYALNQKVEAYLKDNPAAQRKLKDFESLEASFASFPITEPPEHIVQKVQSMAQEQLQPGTFSFFKSFSFRRSLAWAMMVFVVVGLSLALKEMRENLPYTPGLAPSPVAQKIDTPVVQDSLAHINGNVNSQNLDHKVEMTGALLQDYTKALGFYHGGQFKEANQLFSRIMTTNPTFAKKVDLYDFWAKSLEELGDVEGAKAKRLELEKLKKPSSSF